MKVLTIKQPWATLIMQGDKRFEFRSWQTKYRGDLLIHAGKGIDKEAMKRLAKYIPEDMPTGKILGKVNLVDCIKMSSEFKEILLRENKDIYTDSSFKENYGWQLEDVEVFKQPIEAKVTWDYGNIIYKRWVMKNIFIEYPRCSTCKKAKKWLEENNIEFEDRNIIEETPTIKELTKWIKKSRLDIKKWFNTSGLKYKELNLKEKLSNISDKEKIKLLASDGMLIKRPVLVSDKGIFIGFNEDKWNILK